jgi:hypothetical protein
MATFPTLKTGAVSQYPLSATSRYSTQTVQFLNGTQQTFKLFPGSLRRWIIQLDALDEQELGSFISFVETQGGAAFSFTDPATGTTVANCIISGDQAAAGMTQELSGQTHFVIEEIA